MTGPNDDYTISPLSQTAGNGGLSLEPEDPSSLTASQPSATPFHGVMLPINVRERAALYASYMSFVKGGGFFVPTTKTFKLGEEVFLVLNLNIPSHNIEEKLPVHGKVVWLTPEMQRPGKVRGIGVQFNEDQEGSTAQLTIERILGRHLASTRETHTL